MKWTQIALGPRAMSCAWHRRQFLVWHLTKGAHHVTDATNASRTQLFDVAQQSWSDPLLELFDVPAAVLPRVLDCVADFGTADPEWFGAAIPILGIAGISRLH